MIAIDEMNSVPRLGEGKLRIGCAAPGCANEATETGFCDDDERWVLDVLLSQLEHQRPQGSPAERELRWYREETGSVISKSEAECLRLAAIAEWEGRRRGAPLARVMSAVPGRIDAGDCSDQRMTCGQWLALAAFAVVMIAAGILRSHGGAH